MQVYADEIERHLGRYECIDPGSNTSKYWEVLADADHPGRFGTRWGRIGAKNTQRARKLNCDRFYAADKLNEKLRGGYRLVERLDESLQMRLCDEQNDRLEENTASVTPLQPSPRRNRL